MRVSKKLQHWFNLFQFQLQNSFRWYSSRYLTSFSIEGIGKQAPKATTVSNTLGLSGFDTLLYQNAF